MRKAAAAPFLVRSWAIAAAVCAVAAIAPGGTLTVQAHHSSSMFDPSPLWVKGTVTAFEPVNPHSQILIEERQPDGTSISWTIEGSSAGRVGGVGARPQVGDVIEVCAFPLRADIRTRNGRRDPYGKSDAFAHGHLLVMESGHMALFGSYGKLDHCIRAGDDAGHWVDFLDQYRRAAVAWCHALSLDVEATSPQVFVAAVTERMEYQCN